MAEWTTRWGYEMAQKQSATGIWRLRTGGYYVEARKQIRGKRERLTRHLPAATLDEARRAYVDLISEIVLGAQLVPLTSSPTPYATYAATIFRRKMAAGDFTSPATVERWQTTLVHLIEAYGAVDIRTIGVSMHEDVKERWAKRINADVSETYEVEDKKGDVRKRKVKLSRSTVNGWIRINRQIFARAKKEFGLAEDTSLAVGFFPTDSDETYTRQSPNALTSEWARKFLVCMRDKFPQHYAMTLLGFVSAQRPSTLRPIRRSGPDADVDWKRGIILIRRSNARGQAVVNRTKQNKNVELAIPAEVMAVLRWHSDGLDREGQVESELLFPTSDGGMRSRSVLDKPFEAVCEAIGLPFRFTPRGMRRTFKDVAREVRMPDVASKEIAGHATDTMHRHYQTVLENEQRHELTKVAVKLGGSEKWLVKWLVNSPGDSENKSGRRDSNPRRPPWQKGTRWESTGKVEDGPPQEPPQTAEDSPPQTDSGCEPGCEGSHVFPLAFGLGFLFAPVADFVLDHPEDARAFLEFATAARGAA